MLRVQKICNAKNSGIAEKENTNLIWNQMSHPLLD